jgi:hypothetical protein
MLLRDLPKSKGYRDRAPSYGPLAAKRDGWNVVTVDHDDREGLVAKYDDNPTVDTSRIEDVDYVLRRGYSENRPKTGMPSRTVLEDVKSQSAPMADYARA